MSILDNMAQIAEGHSFKFRVNPKRLQSNPVPGKDSIFQVPLLGLAILSLARNASDSLPTEELTRWVLATIGRQYPTFRISGGRIAWSVPLRRHCAEALIFLERTGLVEIVDSPNRKIKKTEAGVTFLRRLRNNPDEIGLLARSLDHSACAALQGGLDLL